MSNIPYVTEAELRGLVPVESVRNPAIGDLEGRTIEDLRVELNSIMAIIGGRANFPLQYKDQFTVGTRVTGTLVALVVATLVVGYFLALTGHLTTLPQDIVHLVHHINYRHLAVGLGITILLMGGAALVIYRAVTKKDALLQGERGSFVGIGDHLESVIVGCDRREYTQPAYLDKSTLSNESRLGYLYNIKENGNHYAVSITVPVIWSLPCLVGRIVHELIRAVVIPVYVLIQCLRQLCTAGPLYPGQRPFRPLDALEQSILSLWRVVQYPFYALAFIAAGVYSWIKPMEGRKLASIIETDMNGGVPLAEGLWSVEFFSPIGWLKLGRLEGGGGAERLGRNAFYLAGCWQPIGIVDCSTTSPRAYPVEKVCGRPDWADLRIYQADVLNSYPCTNVELKARFDALTAMIAHKKQALQPA